MRRRWAGARWVLGSGWAGAAAGGQAAVAATPSCGPAKSELLLDLLIFCGLIFNESWPYPYQCPMALWDVGYSVTLRGPACTRGHLGPTVYSSVEMRR
jgi:hypothetical protein